MAKHFYLSRSGTHIGPFTFETVLEKVESQEHQWTDYVYDEIVGEWLMLMEHPDFFESFSHSGVFGVREEVPVRLYEKEWFVLKGGAQHGPFSYLDVVQMLQEKSIFEYDQIWRSKMTTWQSIGEVSEFSEDTIRTLSRSSDAKVSEVFFRRRHPRVNYDASLIVHNSKLVFKGKTYEIGAGGAGILVANDELLPGQSLFLHFHAGDGVPPFNAVCQVVSKQYVKSNFPESESLKYGVKFTTLSQSVRDSIKNFTLKTA